MDFHQDLAAACGGDRRIASEALCAVPSIRSGHRYVSSIPLRRVPMEALTAGRVQVASASGSRSPQSHGAGAGSASAQPRVNRASRPRSHTPSDRARHILPGALQRRGDQYEHAAGHGCRRPQPGAYGPCRRCRPQMRGRACRLPAGRMVAGVAGPVRAGRGVRHPRGHRRFRRRVPGRRVAAGRRRAGHAFRGHRVLRVCRGEDGGRGVPGHGPPGRIPQAGRRDVARCDTAAGVVRGRRSPGRVPGPSRVPGGCRVAGPAAARRGMARVRGRQGGRRRGLVRHGSRGPPGRGPVACRQAAGHRVPAA